MLDKLGTQTCTAVRTCVLSMRILAAALEGGQRRTLARQCMRIVSCIVVAPFAYNRLEFQRQRSATGGTDRLCMCHAWSQVMSRLQTDVVLLSANWAHYCYVLWGRDSSDGRAPDWKDRPQYWRGFESPVRQGLFLLAQSNSSADSLTVSVQPPCAIACNNICAHVKNLKQLQPYRCLDTGNTTHTDRNG